MANNWYSKQSKVSSIRHIRLKGSQLTWNIRLSASFPLTTCPNNKDKWANERSIVWVATKKDIRSPGFKLFIDIKWQPKHSVPKTNAFKKIFVPA